MPRRLQSLRSFELSWSLYGRGEGKRRRKSELWPIRLRWNERELPDFVHHGRSMPLDRHMRERYLHRKGSDRRLVLGKQAVSERKLHEWSLLQYQLQRRSLRAMRFARSYRHLQTRSFGRRSEPVLLPLYVQWNESLVPHELHRRFQLRGGIWLYRRSLPAQAPERRQMCFGQRMRIGALRRWRLL